ARAKALKNSEQDNGDDDPKNDVLCQVVQCVTSRAVRRPCPIVKTLHHPMFHRQQINLAAFGPRRLRFDALHDPETSLERAHEVVDSLALERFHEQRTAWL